MLQLADPYSGSKEVLASQWWTPGTAPPAIKVLQVDSRLAFEWLRYAVSEMDPGSGGVLPRGVETRVSSPTSAEIWVELSFPHRTQAPMVDIGPGTPERLAAIGHYLSLSITQLGRTLVVERPTVYAWLAGKSTPRRRNFARIGRVYDLARAWRSLSPAPLGDLLVEPIEGTSVLDLLSQPDLPEARVRSLLGRLSREAQCRAREAKRPLGLSDAVKNHGFRDLPPEVAGESFDQETAS
ncbi:MAG: hypothetical protein FJ279_21025 [Planctomycetes bacterium]|nr:hypothetical protein [Planctomycetota bacterium]